uniref:Uncharacterized protein n=1 Tax=Mesocestoides corti TaxID=53468 RepID=A0A5K3FW60_MESCO
MKKSGTTQPPLFTSHKPEQHVRRRPSGSTSLTTLTIIYTFLNIFVSNSLHAIGWQR